MFHVQTSWETEIMSWKIQNSQGNIICEKDYTADGDDITKNTRDSVVVERCCLSPSETYTLICQSNHVSGAVGWDHNASGDPQWVQNDSAWLEFEGQRYCDRTIDDFKTEIQYVIQGNILDYKDIETKQNLCTIFVRVSQKIFLAQIKLSTDNISLIHCRYTFLKLDL